jgi:hypothetical protein
MTKKAFRAFAIGDKVKLTGKFLRSTGQHAGKEGQSVWTILGFSNGDRWAIVDQPTDTSHYTAAELTEDPSLRYRRIAVANLYICGQLDSRNA